MIKQDFNVEWRRKDKDPKSWNDVFEKVFGVQRKNDGNTEYTHV